MTDPVAERYARIGDLVQGAHEREGTHLETFLDEVCGDDKGLRDELLELLALSREGETQSRFAPKLGRL